MFYSTPSFTIRRSLKKHLLLHIGQPNLIAGTTTKNYDVKLPIMEGPHNNPDDNDLTNKDDNNLNSETDEIDDYQSNADDEDVERDKQSVAKDQDELYGKDDEFPGFPKVLVKNGTFAVRGAVMMDLLSRWGCKRFHFQGINIFINLKGSSR